MSVIKSIAIFCGSSPGSDKIFSTQAYELGQMLAKRNIQVVYGGAKVGLMGAVADGALSEKGKVIGVLPHFLRTREVAHANLTELILVESMHERKMKMNELSDGVIALPGGYGTMEEFFEMLTWGQLGLHKKPMALFNVAGFYDALSTLIQTMVDKGFLNDANRKMLLVSHNIDDLLRQMNNYVAPETAKWITREKT